MLPTARPDSASNAERRRCCSRITYLSSFPPTLVYSCPAEDSELSSTTLQRIVTVLKEIYLVQNICVFSLYWTMLYEIDDPTVRDSWPNCFWHGFIIVPYLPELFLAHHSYHLPRLILLIFWGVLYCGWNLVGSILQQCPLYPPILPWMACSMGGVQFVRVVAG